MENELNLAYFLDIKKWQKIQLHFSEALGVTISTLNANGSFIADPSIPSRLDTQLLQQSILAIVRCRDCLPQSFPHLEKNWKDGVKCPLGFYTFFIPMRILDTTLAYIFVGPVILGKRPDKTHCVEEAHRLGIEADIFCETVDEIKAFSFYSIKSIIELLYDIASYALQLEYQNKRLKGIVPEYPQIFERVYDYYKDKLLDALLEVSSNFAEAERCSLMLFDESRQQLYIKAAKGIGSDIIGSTRLRMGEGIAGIVAQERRPLLIDDSLSDVRIKARLHQPLLKSSLSLPIKVDDTILGVLNISTYQEYSDKLSRKSLETISSLINLIETTFKDFPKASLA